jgi:hypothetical protein
MYRDENETCPHMYRTDGYKATPEEYYDWIDNICGQDFEARHPDKAKALREKRTRSKHGA